MDPLHRQTFLDCYEDIARDMDPGLALRYSTVRWQDADPGFIRAKTRAEGPEAGARVLLDKLMDLPYDGFNDFVQSLREVPYDHLVDQLLKTRERLKNAVERGEIRRRDLGRRPEVNMEDYFDKVIKNVSYKWDDLARKLGFKRGEIEAIRATESLQGPDKKCREVLERWLERNGTNATLQVLQQALIDIEERRSAKELHVWTEKAQHSLQTTGQEMKTTGKETMEKVDGLGVEQYPAAKGTGQSVKDVTRWITNRAGALAILVTCFVICTWMCMLYCGSRTHEPVFLAAFPRRLKTFVGREDVFSRIDACLQENQTCLIKGLGGVGKTSVAIEYGHRRVERYPGGVFWVRLASKGDLCASISQYSSYISDYLQLKGDLSCKNMKMYFRRYLSSSYDWLLVVDEAVRNTTKELESLLPHTLKANMHVLLTSTEYLRIDNERLPVVKLPPFSEPEAQAMFNKTVRPSSKDDRKEIKRLSRSLGHHPLALQFAFAYIEETGCSVKEYHDKYNEGNATEKVDLLDESGVEQVSNKRIRRVFDITFQYVTQLSSNAAKLLDMTSFMGPDGIPCPVPNSKGFRRLFNTSGKLDKLDTKKIVSVLVKFSLASSCHDFQPCAFSVNRIVQEVVLAQMNESMRITHLENALKYSTLLLRHSNNTTRIQAEFLMAHLHYLALNIDRYQLTVSVTRSSTFLNKSAEFFYRWDACEEAYFFLHVETLLFLKHSLTQDLCFHLHDHATFLNTTLLPCLFDGDVPVNLLVDIADNLYWEAEELTFMQPSSSEAASCDKDYVTNSLENTINSIYVRLLQSRKLDGVDYSLLPASFFWSVSTYIGETPLDKLKTLFLPNTIPNAEPEKYWAGLDRLVITAGDTILNYECRNRELKEIVSQMKDRFDIDVYDKTYDKTEMVSCNLSEYFLSFLQLCKSDIQRLSKVVMKVLFMYYRSMDTSICTNRYYEVMLGLPRESKEFDILEFVHDGCSCWSYLLGDPGVLKSVLSLTNVQKPGSERVGSISPLTLFTFYKDVRFSHLLNEYIEGIIDKEIGQGQSITAPLSKVADCNATTLSEALMSLKNSSKASGVWKRLDAIWLPELLEELVTLCLYSQSMTTTINSQIESDKNRLKVLNAILRMTNSLLSCQDDPTCTQYVKSLLDLQDLMGQLSSWSCADESGEIFRLWQDFVGSTSRISSPSDLSRCHLELIREHAIRQSNIYSARLKHIADDYFSKIINGYRSKRVNLKRIGKNPFVSWNCSRASPSMKALLKCDTYFRGTLNLWNNIQKMSELVNCSITHTGVNLKCITNFIVSLEKYLASISCRKCTAKQKGVSLGQPLSDNGENFHFDQREDRVVALIHKVTKHSYDGRHVVTDQGMRKSKKKKQKSPP